MTDNQAKLHGVKAYKAGKGHAPALNSEFTAAACADGATTKQVIARLKAYGYGWSIAHLADCQTDPTMPSVMELVEIEAA